MMENPDYNDPKDRQNAMEQLILFGRQILVAHFAFLVFIVDFTSPFMSYCNNWILITLGILTLSVVGLGVWSNINYIRALSAENSNKSLLAFEHRFNRLRHKRIERLVQYQFVLSLITCTIFLFLAFFK